MKRLKNIFALPNPDGKGHQVSYELEDSRRVHWFCSSAATTEKPPHGAGSFHDPEQHQSLMERVTDYIKKTQS